ncbi:MAG: 1-acyl-sn-glycerol-3-phosphate acyltransferase [Oscillospiraceae bacterium]|nr:1-acyl-sn-glycerol-3-phosphate acyltransferase [Oscillospiraceae bacterium]
MFFRLRVERSNYIRPEGACIVVSNHSSFMDFLVVMLSLYPMKVNAVTAQKFFLYKPLNRLLPMMGCIPKNLFDPDVRSIIGIKTVLNRGDDILLFPEGRCSCDGFYAGMHRSTGKLIKKLSVPVVSCCIEGSYTCMPFWRDGIRAGRVQITISNLFSPENLQSLSIDEINMVVDNRLSGEDRGTFRTFGTRRLAEGLQYILYWCPKCGQEFTTETKKCRIYCTACGNAADLDRYAMLNPTPGSVVPKDIHTWYKEQARYEAEQLHDDMKPINVHVSVKLPSDVPGGGMVTCGSGVISIDPKGWCYEGELKGEQVSLFFPIDTVPALPIDPNDVFQIYAHGAFYMFSPDNKRECIKYSVIGECAYWKFASNVQMTPRKDSGFC